MCKKYRMALYSILLLMMLTVSFAIACESRPKIIGNPDTQKELSMPSISEWRYKLDTSTYSYLTKNLNKESYTEKRNNGIVTFYKYTLDTFWINDKDSGRKWSFHKEKITLDEKYFGSINLSRAADFQIR